MADAVVVEYQVERAHAPPVSHAEEWLAVAAGMSRFTPVGILFTPLGTSAGPLSELHRISPRPTSRTVAGSNEEVRIREIRLPDGSRLKRSYDAIGRLAEVRYPDDQVLQLTNNRVTLSDSSGPYYNVGMNRNESGRLRSLEY
jgi:YD repeat-containing protein